MVNQNKKKLQLDLDPSPGTIKDESKKTKTPL